VPKFCVDGHWQAASPCAGDTVCKAGVCAKPKESCDPGTSKGCDGYQIELICAPDGTAWLPKKCPGKQQCAAGKCRDVICTPSVAECSGVNTFHTCLPDGSAWGTDSSCKTGATCLGGKCLSLCENNNKVSGNVGCEYWSVDMDSYHDTSSALFNPKGLTPDYIPHSVVVFNPGIYDATLKFTIQATCPDSSVCQVDTACGKDKVCDKPGAPYQLAIADPVVKAGASKEFKMPVLNAEGNTIGPKGVHLTSDQPIIAWQFNPFNAEGAASNDGSLLLPQNVLGKQYYAVSMPSGPIPVPFSDQAQHGYFSVVAASPGTTQVTITPACDVTGNPTYGIPPLKQGVPWTVALLQYQVLTLQATEANLFHPGRQAGRGVRRARGAGPGLPAETVGPAGRERRLLCGTRRGAVDALGNMGQGRPVHQDQAARGRAGLLPHHGRRGGRHRQDHAFDQGLGRSRVRQGRGLDRGQHAGQLPARGDGQGAGRAVPGVRARDRFPR
jgi:hypothetical protein